METPSLTGTVQQPSGMAAHRYRRFDGPDLPDRRWPSQRLTHAPLWAPVDLRDGNQALVEPMSIECKHTMFDLLVRMGFKEIEVGFPAASQTDFDFVRELVEQDRIPDDVAIQVIMQAREEQIERSYDAVAGAPRSIIHLYNSVSPLQRRVVFDAGRAEVLDLAVRAARMITKLADSADGVVHFEYSPESFTATEMDYALEITEAVTEVWQPEAGRPIIVNLPATVECTTANGFADQVEWMHRNLSRREHTVLSLHPHNDRGTGVAAAELGLMAGADRIEGCLFGNGERTGNVDLVTLGMNLFSHGIDPMIDFSDLDAVRSVAEECTRLPVHPRHPYSGELVYTSFSGSHQDAIKKGFDTMSSAAEDAGAPVDDIAWAVPYLPIDPKDVGRSYQAVIRVNSQSGKAGAAYLLKSAYELDLPRALQVDFAHVLQRYSEQAATEIGTARLWELFEHEYLGEDGPVRLVDLDGGAVRVEISGRAESGPVSDCQSLVDLLATAGWDVRTLSRSAHCREDGTSVVYCRCSVNGTQCWGVSVGRDEAVVDMHAIAAAVDHAASAR